MQGGLPYPSCSLSLCSVHGDEGAYQPVAGGLHPSRCVITAHTNRRLLAADGLFFSGAHRLPALSAPYTTVAVCTRGPALWFPGSLIHLLSLTSALCYSYSPAHSPLRWAANSPFHAPALVCPHFPCTLYYKPFI